MRTPEHVLIDGARRLIREKGWCQHALARNECGVVVGASSTRAASFCVLGALERAWINSGLPPDTRDKIVMALSYYLALKRGYWSVADWNDAPGRTKEEVLSLLDEVEKKL